MTTGPRVIVDGLRLELPGHRKSRPVVASLSFRLEGGSLALLTGPNGAGKSSTIRALAGLQEPSAGTVLIDGESPRRFRRSGRLGYLPESVRLPPGLTLRGLFLLGAERAGRSDPAQAVTEALERTALPDPGQLCGRLSKGMTRRVAEAFLSIGSPDLLLLDEPWSGLDREARHRLRASLEHWSAQGRTVVIATHQLEAATPAVDRVIEIGPPVEVATSETG